MRLLSVQLRNYRIHRELDVIFDRERTLIGGANETGKSTLVEAVHRALFLKAKGQTEFHRAMISPTHGGEPSVELTFEAEGQTWTVKKRFSNKGSTTLIRPSAEPITGEEAEAELARLVGVAGEVKGKAVHTQWEHLWVWQGTACEDPSRHATTLRESLVQRVQAMGAATLLQSELDSQIAAHFAEAKSAIFTLQEKSKAGSDLEVAERAVEEARARHAESSERLSKQEAAAQKWETANAELPGLSESLALLEKEQAQLEDRSARLAEFQRQHSDDAREVKDKEERLATRKAADAQIHKLEAAIRKREETLAPLQQAREAAAETAQQWKEKSAAAERSYEVAAEAFHQARLRNDLAQAHRDLFNLNAESVVWKARREKITALQSERADLEKLRSQLPNISDAQLRRIEKLELEREKAQAAISSVAAEIEVLSANQPVSVDGKTIAAGESRRVVNDAVVKVGDGVEIRIRPGGGGTLADARQRVSDVEKELRFVLDGLALKSASEAVEARGKRRQMESQIETVSARMDALDPADLEAKATRLMEQIASKQAQADRWREMAPGYVAPVDEAAAVIQARECEESLRQAEGAERAAKADRDAGVLKSREAETLKTERHEAWERENRELEAQRVELRLLTQSSGTQELRAEGILAAEAECRAAQAQLQALAGKISELQPELLAVDRERIKRATGQARDRRDELQRVIAASAALLQSDGGEDLRSAHSIAAARLQGAEEELRRATQKADAIALLHRCFQEEQQSLAAQFTRPLAEKISGYLQCLFGATAEASVQLNADGFSGLQITRGGAAVETWGFGTLSGGAQEQTAAATRLAMAEVLASEHGGCLPVVFDDAFAYSDPERVKRLQRMLDLAASRGLQVIILTCNPTDYATLGARQISLPGPPQ